MPKSNGALPPIVASVDSSDASHDIPDAMEGVPAPFDFATTDRGTITVSGSDTNAPSFPFTTSRDDHARRLEACKAYAAHLVQSLRDQKHNNVRAEFLTFLERYQQWLPKSVENGNMLLADGMMRSLAKLFAQEAEILPPGFAAELHTLIEQHIGAAVYYPEVGTFNRDIRDGKPSRPFPLEAAEAFAKTVRAYTPRAFEPPVAAALSDAQTIPPPLPAMPADMRPLQSGTLGPPPIPGGETDPRKSREFATAATANRLWQRVQIAAHLTTIARGVRAAAGDLAPHARDLIQWLREFIESLPRM